MAGVEVQISDVNGNLYDINAEKINDIKLTRTNDYITISSEQEMQNVDINELTVTSKNNIANNINSKNIVINKDGNVIVEDKNVEKISLNQLPSKLKYIRYKEQLDVTGGELKVTYDDKTEKNISVTNDMVTGFDNTVLGKETLTVTYEGKTTTFEIEIVEDNNNQNGEDKKNENTVDDNNSQNEKDENDDNTKDENKINTEAITKLPQTGDNKIIIQVVLLSIMVVVTYILYRKY